MLPPTSPLSPSIDGVFIHVRHLRRAAEWYSAVFALPIKEHELSQNYYTLNAPDQRPWITLDDHAADPAFHFRPAPHPICTFVSTDLVAARDHLAALGAELVGDVTEVHPGLSSLAFRDPDGNLLMAICRG
ncbi:VOC family protein [uncultured Deinococcus sp.]|uniref:VOC family protein n=1 Tax=uncultured Deinococcus sp. TaxID=158789 RepID=UPI0025DBB926|nr:VOC family protein [uncultured Deinococcus sp.]